uniref:Jacalin-type lectin domain-containing protein n=1 Tax=Kalanchoe fedtschenkoi TaxID=63787 RepID=A0A7N0UI18_KALFE
MASHANSMHKLIKLPATGSSSSYGVTAWDQQGETHVCQIFVSYTAANLRSRISARINGLQFQYVKGNHSFTYSDMSNVFGQLSGTRFHAVKLDYPREYLTCVTIYGNATGIALKTNLGKTHGPFGNVGDPTACFCLGDENQFGGFHGAADSWGICSYPA